MTQWYRNTESLHHSELDKKPLQSSEQRNAMSYVSENYYVAMLVTEPQTRRVKAVTS